MQPMTYEALQDHLLDKFDNLINKQASQRSAVMDKDDVEQIARIRVFENWQEGELFGVDDYGQEVRTVNLSQCETDFKNIVGHRVTNAANRAYRPSPIPEKKRTNYSRIVKSAEDQGLYPRDICESHGMSLEEFDRLTGWVAVSLSVDLTDRHDADALWHYTDDLLDQIHEPWSDAVEYVQKDMARQAREVLTPQEDEIVEIFYWDMADQRNQDNAAVAEHLNDLYEPEGKRFTPRYVAPLHREALHKMRHALDVDQVCGCDD